MDVIRSCDRRAENHQPRLPSLLMTSWEPCTRNRCLKVYPGRERSRGTARLGLDSLLLSLRGGRRVLNPPAGAQPPEGEPRGWGPAALDEVASLPFEKGA